MLDWDRPEGSYRSYAFSDRFWRSACLVQGGLAEVSVLLMAAYSFWVCIAFWRVVEGKVQCPPWTKCATNYHHTSSASVILSSFSFSRPAVHWAYVCSYVCSNWQVSRRSASCWCVTGGAGKSKSANSLGPKAVWDDRRQWRPRRCPAGSLSHSPPRRRPWVPGQPASEPPQQRRWQAGETGPAAVRAQYSFSRH